MGMHDYARAGPIMQGLASTVDLRKESAQPQPKVVEAKLDKTTNVWFTVAEGLVVDVGAKK